ncbi:MAG TPA: papain-like cysteine protease family protein [Planctomycetaceae bacterium]|jgi:hypothetical protein
MPLTTSTIVPISSLNAGGGGTPPSATAPAQSGGTANATLSLTDQANQLYAPSSTTTNSAASAGGGAAPTSGGHYNQSSISPLARLQTMLSLIGGDALGATPTWKVLSFLVQHQEQHQWCWAAVTASLAMYYNPSSVWTQGLLANDQFSQTICTISGSSPDCDRPWFVDVALQRTGNWVSTSASAVPISQLRSEIDSGRPLAVRVGWNTGGGHFLTLIGYSDSNWVSIQDPWYGASTLDYDVFSTAYQGAGTWTHSFFTKG